MSILKRSVFVDDTNGIMRFWDWALVTTTIGTMAEPFIPGARHELSMDFEEFDPVDEINRIDDIRAMSIDKSLTMLSGGDRSLIGGCQLPRTGR